MNVELAKSTITRILIGIMGCFTILFLYFPSSVNFELNGCLYDSTGKVDRRLTAHGKGIKYSSVLLQDHIRVDIDVMESSHSQSASFSTLYHDTFTGTFNGTDYVMMGEIPSYPQNRKGVATGILNKQMSQLSLWTYLWGDKEVIFRIY
jgi:hypothetical protein